MEHAGLSRGCGDIHREVCIEIEGYKSRLNSADGNCRALIEYIRNPSTAALQAVGEEHIVEYNRDPPNQGGQEDRGWPIGDMGHQQNSGNRALIEISNYHACRWPVMVTWECLLQC